MSAYFDTKARELSAFKAAGHTPQHDDVRAWVRNLRLDIVTACEFDRDGPMAFPADFRDHAYTLFIRCDPESWPYGVSGGCVDYEHDEQGMRLFSELVERLHDLFHEAAHAGWPGRDNPRSAVQAMDCRMEERCAELIAADPTLTTWTTNPPPELG